MELLRYMYTGEKIMLRFSVSQCDLHCRSAQNAVSKMSSNSVGAVRGYNQFQFVGRAPCHRQCCCVGSEQHGARYTRVNFSSTAVGKHPSRPLLRET